MAFYNPSLTQDELRILQKQIEVEYKDILAKKTFQNKDENNIEYSPEEVVVSYFYFYTNK